MVTEERIPTVVRGSVTRFGSRIWSASHARSSAIQAVSRCNAHFGCLNVRWIADIVAASRVVPGLLDLAEISAHLCAAQLWLGCLRNRRNRGGQCCDDNRCEKQLHDQVLLEVPVANMDIRN
jgi:hypothetical protein